MEDSTNMYMPVAPAYGAGNQNGFGFGGDWAWILLLLILGWGNNGFGGNGNGIGGLYPWMNNSQNINDGFRDQMMNSQIAAIQSQMSQCCCDNRLATANLSSDIAREACATRATVSDGLRDLMAANAANTNAILGTVTGGIQAIKDQLCQDKIDAKNDEIAQLRAQITALNLAASQNAQTATILANNEAQTVALERYLAPTPVPAYVVQNPNCCNQNVGCSCGV